MEKEEVKEAQESGGWPLNDGLGIEFEKWGNKPMAINGLGYTELICLNMVLKTALEKH